MQDTKRMAQRAPYTDNVLINGSILARGIDISEGGLYVHTGRNFAIGDVVRLRFRISGKDLELTAQVVTCQESVGMGLKFLEFFQTSKQAIAEYVASHESNAKPVIMVVDDNDASRRINKSKLILEGFNVTEAADGLEAVKKMTGSSPVDLIVLDLCMKGMDGFKVLSFMREHEMYKNIPVLVLSAREDKSDKDKALGLGAVSFLVKMRTSPAKLTEVVKRLLAK